MTRPAKKKLAALALFALVSSLAACGGGGGGSSGANSDPVSPGTLQFTQASVSSTEGNGTVLISVNRTGGADGAVSVRYATGDGTAGAGTDYTSAAGTLSWADGDSSTKSVSVSVLEDAAVEGDETFTVTLSSPSGATLGAPSTATVTILDNDAPLNPGIVQFGAASYGVAESEGVATVTVVRSSGADGAASVQYATANGTAVGGSD